MARARVGTFALESALRVLVADVLAEVGVRLTAQPPTDVVLAAFDGSQSLDELMREARSASGARQVVVILPIERQELVESAQACGAAGVYALGTSLKRLEAAVLQAIWSAEEAGGAPRRAGAEPSMPST